MPGLFNDDTLFGQMPSGLVIPRGSITTEMIRDGAVTPAKLGDSGWVDASPLLVNGWVSYDSAWGPPRYRRIGRIVHLTGLVKNGTTGTTIYVLPVGFRPDTRFLAASNGGEPQAPGRLDVLETGAVIQSGGPTGYFSTHCSFVSTP